MAEAAFDLEQARLKAARRLPAHCFDEFQRLSRTLVHGPAFQWVLVDAPNELLRKQVMQALAEVLKAAKLRTNTLPLSAKIADVATLEARLVKNAAQADVVQVVGRTGWFTAARWDDFNVRRERITAAAHARLVFWLDAEAIALASRGAPDLWAWRTGVYEFLPLPDAQAPQAAELRLARTPEPEGPDNRSMQARHRRIADIQTWLQTHPDAGDEVRIAPLDELGRLLVSVGDLDAALTLWREVVLPLQQRRQDDRAVAIAQSRIADVLQDLGQFDEALRIRRYEELPIYERLGDAHSRAAAQGQIAHVLRLRGQLDEALRIQRNEVLPVFEQIGDGRARAITLANIADVLQAQGHFDEALRIRRDEVLPVFERLGDMSARAVTLGSIADVLQARGQFDEALRIRREEELPVYERLGDVRGRAIAQDQIADMLGERGQLEEALRIKRDEVLPVIEQLGEVRGLSTVRWNLGLLMLKARPEEQATAEQLLTDAYLAARELQLAEVPALAEQLRSLDIPVPGDASASQASPSTPSTPPPPR